jgi:hypothetical protein
VITGSVPNSENPNVVTGDNATQSGLSTPGGHLFAMEDSPSGPMMKMGLYRLQFYLGRGRCQWGAFAHGQAYATGVQFL